MHSSNTRPADILVIGGTGGTGSHVVKALWRRGAALRVMTPSRDVAERLFGRSVEIVAMDEHGPVIPEALSGIRKVLLISKHVEGWVDDALEVLDQARAAGVQHVVRLSAYRCHDKARGFGATIHGERHRWVEDYIESLGFTYTHLRTALTYQWLQTFAGGDIRSRGALALPFGAGRVNLVDARDVAEVAARTLIENGHEGRVYELAGPEDHTMAQVAEKMTRRFGFPVRFEDIGQRQALSWLGQRGFSPTEAEVLAQLFAEGRHGFLPGRFSDLPNLIADAPTTLDQYLADEAYRFEPERPFDVPVLDLAA